MTFKHCLYIILACILSGCSNKKLTQKGTREIIIIPKNNINQKLALRIYIVQCLSEESWEEIHNLESEAFFPKVNALSTTYPNDVKIWSIDIIENSYPTCLILPNKKKFFGIIIFFNFTENTENKIIYPTNIKSLKIVLENNTFEILENYKKFQYLKEKEKQPLCIYLKYESCIGTPKNNQKTNKVKSK